MSQILLLLALLIPAILFMLTQQNTLAIIKPENRLMSPGSVWLQIIPFVGQIWQFFVVTRIAGSISKQMESKNEDSIFDTSILGIGELNNKPTLKIGIAYCILFTTGILVNLAVKNFGHGVAMIGSLFSLSGMVCWIIYWVQLIACKNKIRKILF